MTKLVFASYSYESEIPEWVLKLKENEDFNSRYSIYFPNIPLINQVKNDKLKECLNSNPKSIVNQSNNLLAAPFNSVANRLLDADVDASNDLVFKNMYVMLRSDLVIVDLNSPSYGNVGYEVSLASQFSIPVFGISYRYVNSPYILNTLSSLITPKNINDITHTIDGYFHKAGTVEVKTDDSSTIST